MLQIMMYPTAVIALINHALAFPCDNERLVKAEIEE